MPVMPFSSAALFLLGPGEDHGVVRVQQLGQDDAQGMGRFAHHAAGDGAGAVVPAGNYFPDPLPRFL